MPACVRSGLDVHVGHASPTPNPFHQTAYTGGSPNVSINSAASIRIGDTTSCGDPAVAGSSTVRVNSIAIHRVKLIYVANKQTSLSFSNCGFLFWVFKVF